MVEQVWAEILDGEGWKAARRDAARLVRWRRRCARMGRSGVVKAEAAWVWLAWRLGGFEKGAQVGRTVEPPEGEASSVPAGWVLVRREATGLVLGDPASGQAYRLLDPVVH